MKSCVVTTKTLFLAGTLLCQSYAVNADYISQNKLASLSPDTPTLHWAGCGITRKAFMSELASAYKRDRGIDILLDGGGATKGIRDTAAGIIPIGGSCRLPLSDAMAIRFHPKERNIQTIPIAWDALVVIVHKDNPVDSISIKQLRDLLTGHITNWKQLGGSDATISLQTRKGKISGVGHTLRFLLFGNPNQDFTPTATQNKSSGPLELTVETQRNAIAVTGVSSARKRNVKILKLAGIEPSYDNLKSSRYLLYRPLYLVIRKDNLDPMVHDFIQYATGPKGAQVLRSVKTLPYRDAPYLVIRQLQGQRRALNGGL